MGGLDDLQSLRPSLELAVKVCMAKLQVLRTSANADKHSEAYSEEERVLKLSLSSLIAQLQGLREAGRERCYTLLLAVLPGALKFLKTTAAIILAQASPA